MATILEGDIKLLASRVMDDVPEGGGGPTGTEIPYGTSNAMYQDITEADRAGGNVSIRQAHVGVLTANVEPYLGANLILSELPNDPNVSITLARCDLFARRTAIAAAIANYLIQGTTWSGVLLEDHVVGMLSIQILHRPGTPAPDIGRTLVLVYQQGTSSERIQYVRVTRTETEARTFTYGSGGSGGSFVDFQASVTKVDLQDALRYAFPGSPPSRDFAPAAGKTVIRDTTVADAATYYGASPIVGTVALGDSVLRVQSIYTQLVPSSRTETSTLDQRPAAERTLVLAEAPRRVEVPVAAHSRRIRINQSNRGSSYVALLKPLPEPGTVVVSFRSLGNWYALTDDGNGVLTGPGSGRVIYNTGSMDMALASLPDDASSIIIQWAERVAYTNRASQGAQMRAPEVAWQMARRGTVPGTWTVRWPSGGVMRTASDNGAGKITGDAQGEYDYPSSSAFMRLGAIIDPGGEYEVTYDAGGMEEEVIAAPALDAAGQATLVLTKQPLAGSIEVAWITAQEVSSTSGTSLSAAEAGKVIGTTKTVMGYVPQTVYGTVFSGSGGNVSAPPVSSVTAPVSMVQVPIYRISNNTTTSTWSRMTAQDATDSRRVITAHSITDDGAGGFVGGLGTVSYAGKTIVLKLASQDRSTVSYKSDHEDAKVFDDPDGPQPSLSTSSKGGEYGTTAVGEQQVGSVIVRYKVAPVSATTAVERFAGAEIVIDLLPYTTDRAVPGSVRFAWMGETYEDFEGVLYRGRTSNAPGIASGSMDYAAGLARMTDYVVGPSPTTVTLQSLWTRRVPWSTGSIFFRTQSAPLKPGGVVLSVLDLHGNALTATTGTDGAFAGTHMRGRMDFESGVGELQFGDFVDPATPHGRPESGVVVQRGRRRRSGGGQDLAPLACGPDHAADQLGVLLVPADRCGHPGPRPRPPAAGWPRADLSQGHLCGGGAHGPRSGRHVQRRHDDQLRSRAALTRLLGRRGRQADPQRLHPQPGRRHDRCHGRHGLGAARGGQASDRGDGAVHGRADRRHAAPIQAAKPCLPGRQRGVVRDHGRQPTCASAARVRPGFMGRVHVGGRHDRQPGPGHIQRRGISSGGHQRWSAHRALRAARAVQRDRRRGDRRARWQCGHVQPQHRYRPDQSGLRRTVLRPPRRWLGQRLGRRQHAVPSDRGRLLSVRCHPHRAAQRSRGHRLRL